MASDPTTIFQLLRNTMLKISDAPSAWADFLKFAGKLYKYSFLDQVLIYAQRPDATACAGYEVWNNTMHRYIRRGRKGIALIETGDKPGIKNAAR